MMEYLHQSFFKPYFIFSILLLQQVLRQLNKVSGDNMAHLPETGLSQTSVMKTCILVTILMLQRDTMNKDTYQRKHLFGGFLQRQRMCQWQTA